MAGAKYRRDMTDERTLMLSGSATYLADFRHPMLEGEAHAVFVRSLLAHARFTVDVGAALSAPGVLAAITEQAKEGSGFLGAIER